MRRARCTLCGGPDRQCRPIPFDTDDEKEPTDD